MAVATFFLMGFRAMSDMIKEIFPPGEDNALAKIITERVSKDPEGGTLVKLFENLLRKLKDIAFEEEDLRFHIIKQLEPAFGHKVILKLESVQPIAVTFNKNDDIFEVSLESKNVSGFPGIIFPLDLFKKFLIEDLDVLRFITEFQVQFEEFLELDEIIVRALLGFTTAFFINESFRERVKKELPASLTI